MKITFLGILFLIHLVTFSQTDTKIRMMFSDFTQGTVVFKDGTSATASLNYDTYEEEMIFKNRDEIMAVALPETILKITINDKTFEWLEDDIFLEKIDSAGVVVYKRNRNKLMSKGKGVPFGGASNNAAVNTVTRMPHGVEGQAKDLTIDEEFELIPDNLFYAKRGNNFKDLISPKHFSKVYDFNKKELEKFIKTKNIDLQKTEDVIQLIQHFKKSQ